MAIGDHKTCKAVIDTMISELHGPFFPNIGQWKSAAYNSADAPLWFFWALQQYAEYTETRDNWKEYGQDANNLKGFKDGTMLISKCRKMD